jgi:DNA-binding NtrC family response regulator
VVPGAAAPSGDEPGPWPSVTLTDGDAHREQARDAASTATLTLILQRDRLAAPPARILLTGADFVLMGRGARGGTLEPAVKRGRELSLCLPDPHMSTQHARLLRLPRGWGIEDGGSRNGTFVDGERVTQAPIEDGALIELGRSFFIFRSAAAAPPERQATAGWTGPRGPRDLRLATLVPELERGLSSLAAVAPTEIPVLLLGETGVGKEVLARALHRASQLPGDLVAVNCAALPDSLLASELFGHRRGAFSGAVEDRVGLVRSADRGTLFLDEVGDLSLAAQAALLRVLQEREVLPVGATRPVQVAVRFVAATHRPLPAMVAEGRFRQDLLARISGFVFGVPPLRQRREDLGLIMGEVLVRLSRSPATVRLGAPAARALLRYRWPLNVRELEHVLRTAVVLAGDGPIEVEHLPEALQGGDAPLAAGVDDSDAGEALLEARVRAALERHQGNVSAVARELGKGREQVHRWLRRLGLKVEDFRPR